MEMEPLLQTAKYFVNRGLNIHAQQPPDSIYTCKSVNFLTILLLYGKLQARLYVHSLPLYMRMVISFPVQLLGIQTPIAKEGLSLNPASACPEPTC